MNYKLWFMGGPYTHWLLNTFHAAPADGFGGASSGMFTVPSISSS